uniref:Peptidase S1 domain-containing protein n=1 Tax=Megaselia scalaris TaxID=36166 RepID=T1GVP3_MEGSC
MKVAILVLALACGAYSLTLPRFKAAFSKGDIIDGYEAQPVKHLSFHFCAGSIIDESTILTAGHCLAYPASLINVKAGKHLRSSSDGVQSAKAARTIVHPKYNGDVGPNDIGLIKLATPLNLNIRAEGNPVGQINLASGGGGGLFSESKFILETVA